MVSTLFILTYVAKIPLRMNICQMVWNHQLESFEVFKKRDHTLQVWPLWLKLEICQHLVPSSHTSHDVVDFSAFQSFFPTGKFGGDTNYQVVTTPGPQVLELPLYAARTDYGFEYVLPSKMRSFMANRNLVPVSYTRKVLQVENHHAQARR